jgi:hypothetical protein
MQGRQTVVQIEPGKLWGQYDAQQYHQNTCADIAHVNSKKYRTQNRPLRNTFLNIQET